MVCIKLIISLSYISALGPCTFCMGYTYKGYKLELSKAPLNHTVIDLYVYNVDIYRVRSYNTNSIFIIIMANTKIESRVVVKGCK